MESWVGTPRHGMIEKHEEMHKSSFVFQKEFSKKRVPARDLLVHSLKHIDNAIIKVQTDHYSIAQ